MPREIWHELFFHVSPQKLYEAITDPKKLAQWWTTDVKGVSLLGKYLEFGFGETIQEMLISDLKPDKLVHWTATEKGLADWAGTILEFRIFRQNDLTYLHFHHSNWREDAKMYAQCNTDWAFYLLSLREFVEKGKGRPFPRDILNNGL
ncbi:MAG TPA: SRPBCC domain-containing protein [Thermodesulfobacteriota bacterium]|nr:SRPBCC domain-containing protein [Thermodesulfobacteriota bacterium]